MELLTLLWKFPWKLLLRILSSLKSLTEQILVFPILKESHQYHLDLRKWQRRWEPLVGPVEYQLALESTLTNERNPMSRILLRNQGGQEAQGLEVSVVARSGTLLRSETISVPSLPPGFTSMHDLPNIPLQHLWGSDRGIFVSYETINVIVRSGHIAGIAISPMHTTRCSSPLYLDFLNIGWWTVFRGRRYNTKAIEDYITHCQQWLCHNLAGRWGVFTLLLAKRPILRFFCWTMLILGRRKIQFSVDGPCWWERPSTGQTSAPAQA